MWEVAKGGGGSWKVGGRNAKGGIGKAKGEVGSAEEKREPVQPLARKGLHHKEEMPLARDRARGIVSRLSP